jgi:predicted ATPase
VEALCAKKLLLVLDNCEHLLNSCAALASALLQGCPHLQILATSREALGLPAECVYVVPSLSFPRPGQAIPPADLLKYEAIDLFARRARAALPDFVLNAQNAAAVMQICRQLDGIPLALELAAARLKGLDIDEIADQLDDHFRLLRGGDRTAPPRLQTMRASIDWSYQLLQPPEKILLRRLSVFAGGWSLAAAKAVCAGPDLPEADLPDLLEGLVNKSLLLVQRTRGRALRYRLLETVHQYAAARASQAGEVAGLRDRHLAWYAAFARQASAGLQGASPLKWLNRVDDELDNLRSMLEWAQANNVEAGLRLVILIDLFWYQRGHVREQYAWINSFLDRPEAQALPLLRAQALEIKSTILYSYLGNPPEARLCAETSLALACRSGDRRQEAASLYQLGYIAANQGEAARGRKLYEQSLALFRELGDKLGQAGVLAQLGYLAFGSGYPDTTFTEQSLALCREVGDQVNISRRLKSLATLTLRKGDYAAARQLIEQALSIQRKVDLRYDLAESLDVHGQIAFRMGDPALARACYLESIALNDELGRSGENIWPRVNLAYLNLREGQLEPARRGFLDSLDRLQGNQNMGGVRLAIEGLASLAVAEDQLERAACLYAWADSICRKETGHRPAIEQADVDQDLAALRLQLDGSTRQAAVSAGQAMTLAQAIAYAMGDRG